MDTTPPGYWKDSKGRLVPDDMVKEIDKARTELVLELVQKAKRIQGTLEQFKADALAEIRAFVQLSAERYEVDLGGEKGNVTLLTYDGQFKILRSVRDQVEFTEQLSVAKDMIEQCIQSWSQGSRPEIQALITQAFETDRKGQISASRLLSLRRLDIKDPLWRKAMDALSDSIVATDTTTYIRIYELDEQGRYQAIPLDVASV